MALPEIMDTTHNGVILAVTSARGGMGKSTISSLLASQIAKSSRKSFQEGAMERPLKVCLVDMDIISPQQGIFLNARGPGALQLSLAEKLTSGLVYDTLVDSPDLGYKALLSPLIGFGELPEGEVIDLYSEILSILRTMFDVIIVDTASCSADFLNQQIFADADAILLVTTTGISQFVSMNKWINNSRQTADDSNRAIDIHKVYLVINQVHPDLPIDETRLRRANLGMPVLASIPADSFIFQKLYDTRQAHEIIEFHENIGNAYFKLAENMISKCNLGIKVTLSPIVKEK